jgi:hypothetical protein
MTWFSKFQAVLAASAAALFFAAPAGAQLANVKVVTDANPDYSDMESMTRSITGNWKSDQEKMYALFYWDHIARRQTQPMSVHGNALTDPIRQFNDYGFTMCSTISGIKCGEWTYMGYPCRLFDIALHTVPDVWYEGRFHHYDNSLSTMYTLPDGKTIASVEDIGRTMSGPETGDKPVAGYIAMYHCLDGTGPNGYLEGADTDRDLKHLGQVCFHPGYLKYRYYYYSYDLSHRYILNLRDGEVYTRSYSRQDVHSPDAIQMAKENGQAYSADPAYYTPNGLTNEGKPRDPESVNVRYHIRGNGLRTWTPLLDDAHLAGEVYSMTGAISNGSALQVADSAQPAQIIFKVEGANVITSLKINADLVAPTAEDSGTIAISTNNGLQWKDIYKTSAQGDNKATIKLINDVNGAYEVLVKFTLNAKTNVKTTVGSISFDTITQINSKTQPSLRLGANTVYVGDGDQSESIVYWPDLRNDMYKAYAVESQNLQSAWEGTLPPGALEGKSLDEQHEIRHQAALDARAAARAKAGEPAPGADDSIAEFNGYTGALMPVAAGQEGHVVFKIDAPTDIARVTYGGRIELRDTKGHLDFLHSFDGGKTWQTDLVFNDSKAPWEAIRYVTLKDVPPGTRSVLLKYSLNCTTNDGRCCSLYAVHMEADHKLAAPSSQPLEVTFTWSERQKDYSKVQRSHTQLVEKFPFTYKIDVGGYDQPIVDSLIVNFKGARGDVKYGYSDSKDVGGEKWVGNWVTYGKNLALGKPYTVSIPSVTQWGSGDPKGTKLTDGVVGSSYTGGTTMGNGPMWNAHTEPEIVVDLGEAQKCAAFRIHTLGYPWWDAIKGENKDKCEILTSIDGKEYTSQGLVDFNLYWKNLPVNFMYPDDETLCGYNFVLPLAQAVEARYVKYKLTPARSMEVTEVQVLDSYKVEPFDLRIALPDPADNGKAPPAPDLSPNAKKWADSELPTTIGKALKTAPDPSDSVKGH